jgi:signal transduction histidine kinase/ligand-binding sensor domain-containing protein
LFALAGVSAALAGSSTALWGPSTTEPEALRRDVLKTWTTDQGLPHNFVTAITQTPDGFLWVGTNGGLARFDGEHFRTFMLDGPVGLRHAVGYLAVDDEGTLWIGGTAGLFTYRQNRFQSIPLGQIKTSPVEGMLRDTNGKCIWAWTKEGLFRIDHGSIAAVKLPIPIASIRDIQQDKESKLWIADGSSVVVVASGQIAAQYPLPNARLIYTASDGSVYTGDGHTLFRFEGSGFVAQPRQGTEEFVQVLIDREHQIWMASGGLQGISRFAKGKLEMLGVQEGLASNDARVLFEDRSGDMWIGTISGLQRLHHGQFTRFTRLDGLPAHSQYDSIFEDKDRSIWAGTLDAGIWHFENGRWHNFGIAQGIRRGQIRGFADGTSGPIVAVADYGLFALDQDRFHKLPNIPPGYISSPVRTADGSLWFAVLHKGVYRLHDKALTYFGPDDGLTEDVIWSLVPDRDGGLWAGGKTGAYHWDGTRWKHEVLSENAVNVIALPARGGILLGTSNGLLYHNGQESWGLTQEDGLPGDAIFSLSEDAFGDLWVATSRGICRIPHEQLEALNHGTVHGVTPEVFTVDDGLKNRSILPLGQVTGIRSHDGRLWFATESGPVVAEPMPQMQALPHAVLDGIAVDDAHFGPGNIKVEPGRHRLVFAFTAPAFVAPEEMRFRYRMQGWKSEWVDADTLREASYMGLTPGTYTFEVQAADRTGNWGPISEAVSVELEPFFWQTRWFAAIVIVALAAILIEVTRRRTLLRAEKLNLRFQERSAERERIALQIHDTFIQDLTGTALQLELVELQLEEDPKIAQTSLSNLAARMREMVGRSRDIVSNLHSMAGPQFSLLDLLTYVEAEFRLTDAPAYELSSEGSARELHPFLRDEVYSICREAIANAFRHAAASRIEVKLVFLPRKLVITIADDGMGMSETMRTQGRAGHFGLSGMEAHAQRIDATLRVESSLGSGTRVIIEVPVAGPLSGRRSRLSSWRLLRLRNPTEQEKP